MNSNYFLAVIAALAMSMSPLTIGNTFADHDDDDGGGGNEADQGISQKQISKQNSLCVLAFDTTFSCNNLSDLFQLNFGGNALGQQIYND